MGGFFSKYFHFLLVNQKTPPERPRSTAKSGHWDARPCPPISIYSCRSPKKSVSIERSKRRVSTAGFIQPHGGKLLTIKKVQCPKFPKAEYCGKDLKFPLFFGLCPVRQLSTWPSRIFSCCVPPQEQQLCKHSAQSASSSSPTAACPDFR